MTKALIFTSHLFFIVIINIHFLLVVTGVAVHCPSPLPSQWHYCRARLHCPYNYRDQCMGVRPCDIGIGSLSTSPLNNHT